MLNKLLTYLKYEEQLLEEMIGLATQQQKALVKFNMIEIEKITKYQEQVANNLKLAEEQRINILMQWLKISKREALSITLTNLTKKFKKEELFEIMKTKSKLNKLISKLNEINTANKVLTNRAKHSIKEIIAVFTNGASNIYSVRV